MQLTIDTPTADASSESSNAPVAKPFLRWVGGKRKLVPQLLARWPKADADIRYYCEPFVGAGSLFFALRDRKDIIATLGDANGPLIATYRAVRDNVRAVIENLRILEVHGCDKARYGIVRAAGFEGPAAVVAARFIYLNKLCFNGVWRVNRKGEFNVPLGKFKTPPQICDADTLRAASAALAGTRIVQGGFSEVLGAVTDPKRTFIYLDPPYAPVSSTANFTAYTTGGFTDTDQRNLRDWVLRLKQKGAHVLLSNSDAPIIRELYGNGDFQIERLGVQRSVNCDGNKRAPVVELLIS